jgi:hypothetical protein
LYLQLAGSHDSGKRVWRQGVDAHDFEAIRLMSGVFYLLVIILLQRGVHLAFYRMEEAEQ